MEVIPYERPREKLQRRGASFLTMNELVQLVIGSGSAKVSGAKLARTVGTLLKDGTIHFEDLLNINGMGAAKACQIIAAVEIGRRVAGGVSLVTRLSEDQLTTYWHEAKKRPSTVTAIWFDGSMKEAFVQTLPFHPNESSSLRAKRIYAEVVAKQVRYGYFILSLSKVDASPATEEYSFVRHMKEIAELLGLGVLGIEMVTKNQNVSWYRANIPN